MAGALFEGDFMGKAVGPDVGAKKGKPVVRIEMEIVEGDLKGRRCTFEGKLDAENIPFTKRAMLAVGWKGKSVTTFVDDVKAAALTVPFRVEIASWDPKDGRPIQQWSAVRSIGGGGRPLDVLDKDKLRDMDRWFSEVADGPAANDPLPF